MAAVAEKLHTSQESVEDVLTDVNEELMEKYQSPAAEWHTACNSQRKCHD